MHPNPQAPQEWQDWAPRVLHVTPSFFPAVSYGGPVAALYELCRAQRRAGLDVRVLTSDAAGEGKRVAAQGWTAAFGVETFYARHLALLSRVAARVGLAGLAEAVAPGLVPRLLSELRRAEIVHVTAVWSATSVLALGLARILGRRVVLSPRGALLPRALRHGRGESAKLRALRVLAPLLDAVAAWHVTSQEEAAAVRALADGGILRLRPGGAIEVIPNGVQLPEAAAGPPARAIEDGPLLLVLGRIHPVKNLELAIDALAALRALPPFGAARLVCAGPTEDPDYLRSLEARARRLGLSAAVAWPGLVTGTTKDALLRRADVLWLCSHLESFGNVVVEALAQGTPVVAVRTTPWQLLDEEGAGRWVEPRPDALARATAELLSVGADERAARTRRCREVAARFGWPVIERRMRALYRRALSS